MTFIIVGDWGDTLLPGQQQVADVMGNWSEINQPDFIISVGDNFYPNGVRSVDDRCVLTIRRRQVRAVALIRRHAHPMHDGLRIQLCVTVQTSSLRVRSLNHLDVSII